MKLSINNLGRIASAEIEVRPLTVLMGANNTNKTWTAYALYGLLGQLATSQYGNITTDVQFELNSDLKTRIDFEADLLLKSLMADSATETKIDLRREPILLGAELPVTLTIGNRSIGRLLGTSPSDLGNPKVALQALTKPGFFT